MAKKIVITDLDGTLLDNNSKVSPINYQTLINLKNKNIIRAIATGRSLYSIQKVLSSDFPIDYAIFSSGAGIINWETKQIIYETHLESNHVKSISECLKTENIDFMIHKPIPDNHLFVYYQTDQPAPDFMRRCKHYKHIAKPIPRDYCYEKSCQIVAIIPENPVKYTQLKNNFPEVNTIRSTSPLDHKSIWIEFYSKNVSKAMGIKWLCNYLDICHKQTISVGNDYNDIDMLHFTAHSFVTENAPNDVKKHFKVTHSNENNGFSHAVLSVIGL